jgi:spermidine synthase
MLLKALFPQRVVGARELLDMLNRFLSENDQSWFVDVDSEHRLILNEASAPSHSLHTPYQQLDIVHTHSFQTCMILDGRLQFAESDEFIYHEMLIHPAAIIHGNPRKVLILGGGDGCALREIVKYGGIERIVLVDIDETLVDLFREHYPHFAGGAWQDSRIKVLFQDAFTFLNEGKERWDLIFSDLTEPFDTTELGGDLSSPLYSEGFFELVYSRLAEGGIFVVQTGGLSYQPPRDHHHLNIVRTIESIFSWCTIMYEFVPSFGELWGITLASDTKYHPLKTDVSGRLCSMNIPNLKFYDAETHVRLFSSPKYVREMLER